MAFDKRARNEQPFAQWQTRYDDRNSATNRETQLQREAIQARRITQGQEGGASTSRGSINRKAVISCVPGAIPIGIYQHNRTHTTQSDIGYVLLVFMCIQRQS